MVTYGNGGNGTFRLGSWGSSWLGQNAPAGAYQSGGAFTAGGPQTQAPAPAKPTAPAPAATPPRVAPATASSTQAQRDNTAATDFSNYQAPRPASSFVSALGSGPADLSAPQKLGTFAQALGDGGQDRTPYGTDNYYAAY